jgi:hypothetical protein
MRRTFCKVRIKDTWDQRVHRRTATGPLLIRHRRVTGRMRHCRSFAILLNAGTFCNENQECQSGFASASAAVVGRVAFS